LTVFSTTNAAVFIIGPASGDSIREIVDRETRAFAAR
jgi:hypothetical protein